MSNFDDKTLLRISIQTKDKLKSIEYELPYHRIFSDEPFLHLIERLREAFQPLPTTTTDAKIDETH